MSKTSIDHSQNSHWVRFQAELQTKLDKKEIQIGDIILWGRPIDLLTQIMTETVDETVNGQAFSSPISYLTIPQNGRWSDALTHTSLVVEVGSTLDSIIVLDAGLEGTKKHRFFHHCSPDAVRNLRIISSNLFNFSEFSATQQEQIISIMNNIVNEYTPTLLDNGDRVGSEYNVYQLLQYSRFGSLANSDTNDPVFEKLNSNIANVVLSRPWLWDMIKGIAPRSYSCSQLVTQICHEIKIECIKQKLFLPNNIPFHLHFKKTFFY